MKLSIMHLLFQTLLASVLIRRSHKSPVSVKAIPSTVVSGPIAANTVSTEFNLDGPQLSSVNSTAYEWWYFDAVSPDLNSAITIVFWTALSSAFGFIPPSSNPLYLSINFLFSNGSTAGLGRFASEVIITTVGEGSSALWKDTGVRWIAAPDLSTYEIIINDPADGLTGTFKLKSVAPAHYPCGPAVPGQSLEYYPNVAWANAIPDAIGDVDFNVQGEEFSFRGSSYHDHNWGAQPFQDQFVREYWGRGHLGDYSLVWSTIAGADGVPHPTVYVAENNHILTSTCDDSALTLKSLYSNGDPATGTLTGFLLHIKLGGGSYMDVQANIVGIRSDYAAPVYYSWTGSLNGSVNGGARITGGTATFETFDLA